LHSPLIQPFKYSIHNPDFNLVCLWMIFARRYSSSKSTTGDLLKARTTTFPPSTSGSHITPSKHPSILAMLLELFEAAPKMGIEAILQCCFFPVQHVLGCFCYLSQNSH
ncbi:hypothetical protein, partial [Oxalobacter paraformigenes]|uniref:hypothetical protein n=1 Tax=Oxalobacter paraformigenes TaxID=556268 RepID=UPI001E632C06